MWASIASTRALLLAAVLLGTLGMVARSARAEGLLIPLELPQPNFIGLGVGAWALGMSAACATGEAALSLPLNGRWRFAGDIVGHAGDAIDLVDDAAGDVI